MDIKIEIRKSMLINHSINQSFTYSEKKTVINKYKEIKVNKTNKTLRNNVAYYLLCEKSLHKVKKPYQQVLLVQGGLSRYPRQDVSSNSPLVEDFNHCHKEFHTSCPSSPRSIPMICF